jgi:hypothetical protein
MLRAQIGELYYITSIANVPSILTTGILSHNRIGGIKHARVDLEAVQDIRSGIHVGSRMLHDHANLYICGRNAMMYSVIHANPITEVCLLRVSTDVLDLPDVVVTDGNAARRGMTRFYDVASGITALDHERIHAEFWTRNGNEAANYEHKRIKQAEVLIPDFVAPEYIIGAYVPNTPAKDALLSGSADLDIVLTRYPFFQGPRGT